jgi:hypothetical protein
VAKGERACGTTQECSSPSMTLLIASSDAASIACADLQEASQGVGKASCVVRRGARAQHGQREAACSTRHGCAAHPRRSRAMCCCAKVSTSATRAQKLRRGRSDPMLDLRANEQGVCAGLRHSRPSSCTWRHVGRCEGWLSQPFSIGGSSTQTTFGMGPQFGPTNHLSNLWTFKT